MTWQFIGRNLAHLIEEHEAFLAEVSNLLRSIDEAMEALVKLSDKELDIPAAKSQVWITYKSQLIQEMAKCREILVNLTVGAAERRVVERRHVNGLKPVRQ